MRLIFTRFLIGFISLCCLYHLPLHSEVDPSPSDSSSSLYLSLNLQGGRKLELSDGSLYEIAPEDVMHVGAWITPFPIGVSTNDDPDYPVTLTNLTTGKSVKARQISQRQFLEEERLKDFQTAPPPGSTPKAPPPPKLPSPPAQQPPSTSPSTAPSP